MLGMQSVKGRLAVEIGQVASRVGFSHIYGSLRSHLVKTQIVIIMYHRVDWVTNYPWSTTRISPLEFDREMRYLHQTHKVISLDELSTSLCNPKALPPRTAAITIDDGYRDMYINAYPILKKYGLPATVFLATGHIGTGNLFWWDKVGYAIWKTRLNTLELGELGTHYLASADDRRRVADTVCTRLTKLPGQNRNELVEGLVRLSGVDIPSNLGAELILSWDEIKEMSKNGVNFGAHTISHPILTRVPLETARHEIVGSKQDIEKELGQEVTTFCYPNGTPSDFNNEIEEILKSNGFKCAVTSLPPSFVSPRTPLYRLPRIPGASSFAIFELLASGLYLDLVAK